MQTVHVGSETLLDGHALHAESTWGSPFVSVTFTCAFRWPQAPNTA